MIILNIILLFENDCLLKTFHPYSSKLEVVIANAMG